MHEMRSTRPTIPSQHTNYQRPVTPEPTKPREDNVAPPAINMSNRHLNDQARPLQRSTHLHLPNLQLAQPLPQFAPVLNDGTGAMQEGFLAPATSRSLKRWGLIMDQPKTPLDQIFNAFDAQCGILTPSRPIEPVVRPESTFSDSDDSSSSSDSSPSFEETCHSPDIEHHDAFTFPQTATVQSANEPILSSPMNFTSSKKKDRRLSSYDKINWTSDMDEHLWQTFINFVADPAVTPWKMIPGTAPPLGVCYRVAREAKKTWKSPRVALSPIVEDEESPFMSLDAALTGGSSSNVDPRTQSVLGSFTTTERRNLGKWPRSEGSTRRRLRELCKRRPALSPRQRIASPRNPVPNESSSSSGKNGDKPKPAQNNSESAFSTRGLDLSLATSAASTMRPDAPLARLTGEGMKPRPYSTDWKPRVSQVSVTHNKSKSLHLSLGIGSNDQPLNTLAASFNFASGGLGNANKLRQVPEHEEVPPMDQCHPTQKPFHGTRPLSASIKRAAENPLGDGPMSQDTNPRRSWVTGLLDNRDAQSNRRVRSRGASNAAARRYTTSHARYSCSDAAHKVSGIFPAVTCADRHSVGAQPNIWQQLRRETVGSDMNRVSHTCNRNSMASQPESYLAFSRELDRANAQVANMEATRLGTPPVTDQIRRLGSPFVHNSEQELGSPFSQTTFSDGGDRVNDAEFKHNQHGQHGWRH